MWITVDNFENCEFSTFFVRFESFETQFFPDFPLLFDARFHILHSFPPNHSEYLFVFRWICGQVIHIICRNIGRNGVKTGIKVVIPTYPPKVIHILFSCGVEKCGLSTKCKVFTVHKRINQGIKTGLYIKKHRRSGDFYSL